jgi:outer membrane lipoprotein LolB
MIQRRPCLRVLSAAGLWSALLMGGCASTVQPGLRLWSGRLAVTVHDTPAQHVSVSFELEGSADSGSLTLLSPLGTTVARVRWSPQGALWQRGNEWESRPTLGELTRELMGTELPVADLFQWLNGQATNTEGWQVDLSRHSDGRIHAQRQSPLPRAELRLVFEP